MLEKKYTNFPDREKAILFVGIHRDVKNKFGSIIKEKRGDGRHELKIATTEALLLWIEKESEN